MPPHPTPRLEFRSWSSADAALAHRLWCDPQVMKFLAKEPMTPAGAEVRMRAEMEIEDVSGLQYWPIFLREGGDFVGVCGIKPSPWSPGSTELGFHLLPAYWGQGFAREAASACIAHAWGLGDTHLFAGHHPDNIGSQRLLTSFGFKYTHHLLFPPTGVEHPCYRLDKVVLSR